MSGAMYNPGFCAQSASYIARRQRTARQPLRGQMLSHSDGVLRMLQSVNISKGSPSHQAGCCGLVRLKLSFKHRMSRSELLFISKSETKS